MIQEVLSDIKTNTNFDIYTEKSTYKKECIVYSLTKEYDTGCVSQYQLLIKIITETVEKAYEIRDIIDNLMITKGDEKKYDDINSCQQNGGGILWDEDLGMYQTLSYYDLITKSKIDWR